MADRALIKLLMIQSMENSVANTKEWLIESVFVCNSLIWFALTIHNDKTIIHLWNDGLSTKKWFSLYCVILIFLSVSLPAWVVSPVGRDWTNIYLSLFFIYMPKSIFYGDNQITSLQTNYYKNSNQKIYLKDYF